MSGWQRSDSLNYPIVYYAFEGKLERGGRKNQYWIQDLTEKYFDDVIKYYTTEFMFEEVLCKYTKTTDDPICVAEFVDMWRILLNQKLSLICLTKDTNGITKIAGFNCLYASYKKDPETKLVVLNHVVLAQNCLLPYTPALMTFNLLMNQLLQATSPKPKEVQSPISKKILNILKYLEMQRNIYEEFKINVYLNSMGLFVLREFRGEGLGEVILNYRKALAKEVGITLGLNVFTGVVSQKQAERAVDSEFIITGIERESKLLKLMYKEFK